MPNKNSIESEIDKVVGSLSPSICMDTRHENWNRQARLATKQLKNLIQREVKKGRVELMEDVRLAKPAKLKSVRGKEDASSARIGYIGGWNAYYEKLQPILKQVEKSDRLEELEG